jgi:hypothetical protein
VDVHVTDLAEDASRLIALGLKPKLRPSRDPDYMELVRAYQQDDTLHHLVQVIAAGLGLRVLGVTESAGIVLAALPDSPFETKLEHYARTLRKEEDRESERVLHGIAHLAIAVTAFPRPEDLEDDGHVGTVSANQVDSLVRAVCAELAKRAADSEDDEEPIGDGSGMEKAWRAYSRRHPDGATKDNRASIPATAAIITRALNYLLGCGMLAKKPGADSSEAAYHTTARYQLQVRELAATTLFQELVRVGAAVTIRDEPTLHVSDSITSY